MKCLQCKGKLLIAILALIIVAITVPWFVDIKKRTSQEFAYDAEKRLIINKVKNSKINRIEFTDLNQEIYLLEANRDVLGLWYNKISNSKIIDGESSESKKLDDNVVGYLWLEASENDVLYVEMRNSHPSFLKMSTNPDEFNGIFVVFGKTCSVTYNAKL